MISAIASTIHAAALAKRSAAVIAIPQQTKLVAEAGPLLLALTGAAGLIQVV
jgi:hypothetical protein